MNKELREDLEHLIICEDKTITQDLRDDIKMTLDYIDDLEDENKLLNNLLNSRKKQIKNNEEQLKANDLMINDLLNRIRKAIKKLNSAVDHYEDLATDWALKCAIKILRGEDNG